MTVRNIASICNMVSALRFRGGMDPRATAVSRPASRAPCAAARCSAAACAPTVHPYVRWLGDAAVCFWLPAVIDRRREPCGLFDSLLWLHKVIWTQPAGSRPRWKAPIASAVPGRGFYTVSLVPSNKLPSGSASESRFIMIMIRLRSLSTLITAVMIPSSW